jgi:hypothetical protein
VLKFNSPPELGVDIVLNMSFSVMNWIFDSCAVIAFGLPDTMPFRHGVVMCVLIVVPVARGSVPVTEERPWNVISHDKQLWPRTSFINALNWVVLVGLAKVLVNVESSDVVI